MGSSSLTRDLTRAPCIGSVEAEPLVPQGSPESSLSSFQRWDLATATSSLLPALSPCTVSVHTSHVLHACLSHGCRLATACQPGPTRWDPAIRLSDSLKLLLRDKTAVLHVWAQEAWGVKITFTITLKFYCLFPSHYLRSIQWSFPETTWNGTTLSLLLANRIYASILLYFKCFLHWRFFKVPWTARRSNQSILIVKEINPEYSLEGLMLELKLQYFGHLMQKANSWCWERLKEGGEGGDRG